MKHLVLTAIFLGLFPGGLEARPRSYAVAPECNVSMPCEGVSATPRGLRIEKALPFGKAVQRYRPKVSSANVVEHPVGCPRSAFCGCGAAVRVFGSPIRSLWLAANWLKFPRTQPTPGAVAVRRHHVFVLETHLSGNTWQVYDANSGGRQTRIHARSIAGYVIVNPRAG